jgi:hypothetical protein
MEKALEAHRHEATGEPQRVFHMFLTKKPSNPQWTQLFHHSAMSVLQFHPGSILVLHIAFPGMCCPPEGVFPTIC